MFTREQLDHLCMLTALELSDAEKKVLLPQLSAILDFVGQLDACVLDGETSTDESNIYTPTPLPNEGDRNHKLLANIHHKIVDHMPLLQAGLVK